MRHIEDYEYGYELNNILEKYKDISRVEIKGIYEMKPTEIIDLFFNDKEQIQFYREYDLDILAHTKNDVIIHVDYNKKSGKIRKFTISFYGKKVDIAAYKLRFEQFLEPYSRVDEHFVTWSYMIKQSIESASLPLKFSQPIHQEFYPFIPNVENFFKEFFASKASVLILNGPMGTGKTSLIVDMIRKHDREVITTYDQDVMKSDAFYANFITDDKNLIVLEDADLILKSRLSDNKTMSKLLNVSDGIVDTSNKKMLFTANLENIEKIDSAILRPGRCFDVIEFRDLNLDEARVAMSKIDPEKVDSLNKRTYSLAELFNGVMKNKGQNIGFTS